MLNNLTPDSCSSKLANHKDQYYQAMARYCLLHENGKIPSVSEIQEKIKELKKMTFKKPLFFNKAKFWMKNKTILEIVWEEVLYKESNFYEALAIYRLFRIGIKSPSSMQVEEEKRYLFHKIPKKSIFLTKHLTRREIVCLYEASCGKRSKGASKTLKIKLNSVYNCRKLILKKLGSRTIEEAVFYATQVGYLPVHKEG